MKRVLIIGGGASGLMAAISAARAGAAVTVLEHNKQVGKKLLVTGNGRCNLTNVNQDMANYRGGVPGFAEQVLEAFSMHDTVRLFTELGIFTRNRNGYLYPYSDQALAVVEALRMEAEHRKVKLALNTQIKDISYKDGSFEVETEGWMYRGDALILAAGSCAAPQTGSDGSGYAYAKKLGHRIIKPLPALVQLRSKDKRLEKLAGLRMDAKVKLLSCQSIQKELPVASSVGCQSILRKHPVDASAGEGQIMAEEEGEVQFTAYGLSGIPIFQVSRYAIRALDEGKRVTAELDLMPVFEEAPFEAFLNGRIEAGGYKTVEQLLVGLFPKKMVECLRDTAELPKGKTAGELTEVEKRALVTACKHFRADISGYNGFEQAQACCGGVDTAQVNAKSMESRLVQGLYFSGEILDIDGTCGGYNLQWAWSSGYLAGLHAAGEGMKS